MPATSGDSTAVCANAAPDVAPAQPRKSAAIVGDRLMFTPDLVCFCLNANFLVAQVLFGKPDSAFPDRVVASQPLR